MEKRVIFPAVMFVLAAGCFLFGGWQYLQARAVLASSQKRLAFVVTSIEQSSLAKAKKQELYATIMRDLPAAPSVLGIDFSGSFASTGAGDSCSSDGQRAVCGALKAEGADVILMASVCGTCSPRQ